MVREITRVKVRLVIKAFLIMNQGKPVTAKQISDFVNFNHFGLGQYDLHPQAVHKLIKVTPNHVNDIFKNVEIFQEDNHPFRYLLPLGAK